MVSSFTLWEIDKLISHWCGKCQKGFSLVFGSSKCLKCSNSFLSLLIAFALAGIVLVVFLLVLKLTVAVGTINGLIFYANIVSVNRAQLFPSGETNILTVFIAWVNLDLGIETCFFDGMDAYSKAWLQYAFPVYVWVLVGAIILASRHSTRIVQSHHVFLGYSTCTYLIIELQGHSFFSSSKTNREGDIECVRIFGTLQKLSTMSTGNLMD